MLCLFTLCNFPVNVSGCIFLSSSESELEEEELAWKQGKETNTRANGEGVLGLGEGLKEEEGGEGQIKQEKEEDEEVSEEEEEEEEDEGGSSDGECLFAIFAL